MMPLAVFAVLVLALVVAFERLRRRVGEIPGLVRLATREARDQGAAAMQEAVAARLAGAFLPIATHQERLVHLLRVELAGAEVRARTAEARVADTGLALEAALRELRKLVADLQLHHATLPAPTAAALPPAVAVPAAPVLPAPLPSTVPPPRRRGALAPDDGGDSADEDLTCVQPLHLPGMIPPAPVSPAPRSERAP